MSQKSLTELTRPKHIEEIVGNKNIKEIIKYDIDGAKILNQPIPSYIIVGPAGTSKSTFAGIIASLTGGEVFKHIGTEFKTSGSIIDLAETAKDGDVIYIEEAQAIGKNAQVILLEWIENFQILSLGATSVAKVCFIFPTTNSGKLSKPLRERCKTLYTTFYSVADLEEILFKAAAKIGLDLSVDKEGLRLLAESSRGIPRIAIQRLDSIVKVMAVDKNPFSIELVKKTLSIQGIQAYGLDSGDFKYCNTLHSKMLENPTRGVSMGIMSKSTGFDLDVIEVIEQYLMQIGAISVSSSGRRLTDFGLSLLGVGKKIEATTKISRTSAKKSDYVIDMEKLDELMKDPEMRSGGMKAIAPHLNIPYPQGIPILKAGLASLGLTTKKKAGIISMD